MRIEYLYRCTICGKIHKEESAAENCCKMGNLEEIRNTVQEKFYKPLKTVEGKKFVVPVDSIPGLSIVILFEIPEIVFYNENLLMSAKYSVDVLYEKPESVEGSLDALFRLTGIADDISYIVKPNLEDLEPFELLDTLKEITPVPSSLEKYIAHVDEVLRKISKAYFSWGRTYRALAEAYLYEGDTISHLKEKELRDKVEYYSGKSQ